jgi:DsbC/DsbD-like thiol-disulfide interchange protein
MRNPIARRFIFPLFALVLNSVLNTRAAAATIPHGTVDLVAENQWIAPGGRIYLGLNFHLEKGWHIYWLNPGDSGQPPHVEWHLPSGLSSGELEWPAPRRLGASSIVDFGYDDAVMLLVPMRASATLPATPAARLGADLKVLVCREICIPGKAQISLALPIKSMPAEADTRNSELFAATRKSLPRNAPHDWKFFVSEQKESFVLTARIGGRTTRATFFPLEESQVDNSAPQKIEPGEMGFQLTLRKSDQLLKPVKRLRGVLELSATQAYVIDAPVGEDKPGK